VVQGAQNGDARTFLRVEDARGNLRGASGALRAISEENARDDQSEYE
jgi:hypothetical protein